MKRALLLGILVIGITILFFWKRNEEKMLHKDLNYDENNTLQAPANIPIQRRNDTMDNGMIYLLETSL